MDILHNKTIGCIGVGNMGGAIISGLAGKAKICLYDVDKAKARALGDATGAEVCPGGRELCGISDAVIFAVKPDILLGLARELREHLKGKTVISIAAGVGTVALEDAIGGGAVVRGMPNTPALVNCGMTVLAAGRGASLEQMELAEAVFSAVGKTMVLPEKLMDAVTALSGCGPAYAFTMIHAMADGGVKLGIPRDSAVLLAAQTMAGAAAMVMDTGREPMALRGMVTSPGGSTIEAVHCLERAGFSGILMDAVETAALKSAALGAAHDATHGASLGGKKE